MSAALFEAEVPPIATKMGGAPWRRVGARFAGIVLLMALPGCGATTVSLANADPAAGAELMTRRACGSCHRIPGVENATGEVGPPLEHFASREMIAGILPNTAPNLFRFLKGPQAVNKGIVMPDEHLSDAEARHMASYVESLR